MVNFFLVLSVFMRMPFFPHNVKNKRSNAIILFFTEKNLLNGICWWYSIQRTMIPLSLCIKYHIFKIPFRIEYIFNSRRIFDWIIKMLKCVYIVQHFDINMRYTTYRFSYYLVLSHLRYERPEKKSKKTQQLNILYGMFHEKKEKMFWTRNCTHFSLFFLFKRFPLVTMAKRWILFFCVCVFYVKI